MGKLCSVFVSADFLFIFIEIACTVNLIFITCFYGLHFLFIFFVLTFIRKIQLQKWVHQILRISFYYFAVICLFCLLEDEFFGLRTCFLNLLYGGFNLLETA